jgi:lipoprotein-releasing system ATP-binding protein
MNDRSDARPDSVVLRCLAITRHFREGPARVEVLKGVDLTIARGERVAIVGASGAGKSTLLQLMGGLDEPTAGTVHILGEDVNALDEVARGRLRNRAVGFVYQFHHLLPEFTALENVAMPLLLARVPLPQAHAKAAALLAEVGLEERTSHRPGMLSGGEQQRVAVARALAGGPRLLLADEPTGDLDSGTGERLQKLIAELSRARGLTVVVVTHNQALARACDRVLKLELGRLSGG